MPQTATTQARFTPTTTTLPSAREDDNHIIYRASSLGTCPRALYAHRKHHPAQPIPWNFRQIFATGHDLETVTVAILNNLGYSIINRQKELILTFGPLISLTPVRVTGHIDFETKLLPEQQYRLTEVKSMGPDYLKTFERGGIEAFTNYCYQISAYIYGLALEQGINPTTVTNWPWRLVIYKKGELTGLAEDSPDRLIIRTYERPPLPYSALVEYLVTVEEFVATTDDPLTVPCINAYPCPFYYLHESPDYLPLSKEQLDTAIAIKSLDAKIETLEKTKAILRSQLQRQLDQSSKYRLEGMSVTFSDNPRRITNDKVKAIMSAAGVDESDYYKPGEGKQMRVIKKDDNA